jgi:pimeloyl-ACP methyl ester carboxylesterase
MQARLVEVYDSPVSITRSSIRYARSGDLSIAFQVIGGGPLNIVVVPGFISNLDVMVDSLSFGPLLERLGSIGRCVLFDKRGTGLSDRDLGFGSLEERSDDIRAVMDEVGFESASIFGYSEGGPLSVVFAASHPERVDAIALYGTFATLGSDTIASSQSLIEEIRQEWGSGRVLTRFIQDVPIENEAAVEALARYERGAASPGMAAAIIQAADGIDVAALLDGVKAKTLILHSTHDPMIPVAEGRRMAEGIPGARFVEKDVAYHWPWDGRSIWFADEVIAFLAGEQVHAPATDRFLATIVFTDIVGSTEEASRQGDADWTRLLERLEQAARGDIARFDGDLVKTTGDGLLAVFSSPSRAVSAAHAIERTTRSLGLAIRAGVHTGEVEQLDGDLGGIGVHIASRVMDQARDGEVWVSGTVRDLTTGSGLEFNEEGKHVLKGVPGEWELYSSPNAR